MTRNARRLIRNAASVALALVLLGACGGPEPPAAEIEGATATQPPAAVNSSGKIGAELADVPAEVLDAAEQARPAMTILGAEYETRDGREYYDVAGTMPDGSEVELDMTRVEGTWTVVEIQRDIAHGQVPADVAATLALAAPGWEPARIIESDQGDGTVIYEFFGPGTDDPVKHEVKWADGSAELLTEEWAH